MANHGIYATEKATGVTNPVVAESGIPFVVGLSPIQSAESPAALGMPTLVKSWDEAVKLFGYSDDWSKYNLCEFMYSHFKVFGCAPAIFVNILDEATHKTAVAEAEKAVTDHKVELEREAINSSALTVKKNATALVKGTDYEVYYTDSALVVELLSGGSAYSETALTIGYDKVNPTAVTAANIATAMEKVELCATKLHMVPDLIVAPGYSQETTVAAAMATKAAGINGLFKAKALVDIECSTTTTVAAAITKKGTDGKTSKDEIVCWPMQKINGKKFHVSTIIAGRIAATDTDNNGVPYESPSNKAVYADETCLADGTEITLTYAECNQLNAAGVTTVLSFINGWTAWGNYTGCFPTSTDAKDYFIPVSRMFGWVANTIVKSFWAKLDKPMTRLLIDSIVDAANVWINGLVGKGYLLGGRVEYLASENTLEELMAGKAKFHVHLTPPSPSQEFDFVLEYNKSYLEAALAG